MCDFPLDPVTQGSFARVFVDGVPPPNVCKTLGLGINSPQFLAGIAKDFIMSLTSISLIPSYSSRYKLFVDYLTAAEQGNGITPQQLLLLWSSLGEDAFQGYYRVPSKKPYLTFPADHNMHFGIQSEWYFLVGNGLALKDDGTTVPYGIELMLMMNDLFPPEFLLKRGFDVADFRYFDVHFGLTIGVGPDAQYFRSPSVVLISGSSGAVTYSPMSSESPFYLAVGDCTMTSSNAQDLFPMTVQYTSLDQNNDRMTVSLTVTASKPKLLQGDQGCDPCVSGVGSLYYSYPSLIATGTLDYSNSTLRIPADGKWWLDHQWTAGMTQAGYPNSLVLRAISSFTKGTAFVGWDWFEWSVGGMPTGSDTPWKSIDFTMAAIRSTELAIIPSGEVKEQATGKVIDTLGNSSNVTADLYLGGWVQSSDGTIWPTSWRFEFPKQETMSAAIYTLTAYYPLTVGQMAFVDQLYKEGPVSVVGNNGSQGIGFAESVGYPLRSLVVQSKLATLGITDPAAPALLQESTLSTGSKVQSGLLLLFILLIILLILYGVIHGIKHLARKKKMPDRAVVAPAP